MNDVDLNLYNSAELSLLDLVKIFWKQRILILVITTICFAVSVSYLFLASPRYESEVLIEAPLNFDLSTLNMAALRETGSSLIFKKYTSSDVYSVFVKSLLSQAAKEDFFEQIYWPLISKNSEQELKAAAYAGYLNSLKIKQDPLEKNNYKIRFISSSPQQAKELIEKYLQLNEKKTISSIKNDLSFKLNSKLLYISSQMEFIKQVSKKNISDQLKLLSHSLNEAKVENIEKALINRFDNARFETFMLGNKILNSRINELKVKKISAELLPEFRKLEVDYIFYSHVQRLLKKDQFFQNVQFYQTIFIRASETPVSPNIYLILIISLMGGVIIAFIVALITERVNNNTSAKLIDYTSKAFANT